MDGMRKFLENPPVSKDDRPKMAYRNAEKLFRLSARTLVVNRNFGWRNIV
jgi:hypothetical protein